MKFIVADDSKLARLSIVKILKESLKDPEIFQAKNGLEALELTKKIDPEIVFLDLTMPVMSGYEALEAIMQCNNKTKVVIVSADIQPKAKEKVIALGAQLHVQKPITLEKMREILEIL